MNKLVWQLLTPTGILSVFFLLAPWQTRWIFGLSYLTGAPTQFGILSLYATQVWLVLGLVFAYVLHGKPEIRRGYWPVLGLGAAIWFIMLLGFFMAPHSVAALAALIDLSGAAIAFAAMLDKRVELRWVMSAFVAGLLIPVGIGAVQVFFGATGASTVLGLASRDAERLGDAVLMLQDGSRVLRAYGTFSHPNNFGGYLAVGLVTTLALRGRVTMTGAAQRVVPTAIAIIAIVLAIGLALTASRSAVLGLMLGLGLAAFVRSMKRVEIARIAVIPIAIAVIAGALGVVLFAPSLATSLRGGGALEERSLSERAQQYKDFPTVMQGVDWLVGNGPRNYVFALADVQPQHEVWDYQPIHNVPLLIIAEVGILGALIIFGWSSTIDRINFLRFPNRDALAAFAMGNVILVILFFDHYLWSSWSGLVLVAYVMALTVRLGEQGESLAATLHTSPQKRRGGGEVICER